MSTRPTRIAQNDDIAKRRAAPPPTDAPGGANHPATLPAATSPADDGRGCEAGADRITAGRHDWETAKPRKSARRRKERRDHVTLRDVPLGGVRPGEPGTPEWRAKDAAFIRAVIREGRRLGLL